MSEAELVLPLWSHDHHRSGKPDVQCTGSGCCYCARLKLIKQAGQQYAEKGEIEASLLSEITSPMIPEDQSGIGTKSRQALQRQREEMKMERRATGKRK